MTSPVAKEARRNDSSDCETTEMEEIKRRWARAGFSDAVAKTLKYEGIRKARFLNMAIDCDCEVWERGSHTCCLKYRSPLYVGFHYKLGRVIDVALQETDIDPYSYSRNFGYTRIAAMCGHLDTLRRFCASASPDDWCKEMFELYHLCGSNEDIYYQIGLAAARTGRLPIIQYLVRQKGLPIGQTGSGNTTLAREAIRGDHLKVFLWLIREARANRSPVGSVLTTRDATELLYAAQGDCLLWFLRQPKCGQCRIPSGYADTVLARMTRIGGQDPFRLGGCIDLRGRRLGNGACRYLACVLRLCSGMIQNEIDLRENPRITGTGVRRLVRSVEWTPTSYPANLVLVPDPDQLPSLESGRASYNSKYYQRILLPELPLNAIRAAREEIDRRRNETCGLSHYGLFPVDFVCPFPSLVTITSFWIANRISGEKGAF